MRVTGTDIYNHSNMSKIPFGVDSKSLITLEHNMWVCDGSFESVEDNEIGYWSSDLSKDDGTLSAKLLTVTFDGDATYSSLGVDICGQISTDDYSASLTIAWWLKGEVKLSKEFAPTSADYFCENRVENYDKLVISIGSTSKPYRRIRINRILLGEQRTFNPDQLLDVSVLQELSPISNVLPVSGSNFTLIDTDNINFMFQQKQPLSIYINDKLVASHFIKKYSRESKSMYRVSCNDAIGILMDMPFEPVMYSSDTSAKEIVSIMLGDKFMLEWDPALENAKIRGYLNVKTVRDALQQIALSIGGVCSTANRSGIIVSKLNPSDPITINPAIVYIGSRVDVESPLTKLIVYAHTYTETTNQKAGDDIVKVIAGGKTTYYLHSTDQTTIVNDNVSPTAKPNVKEIRDATLINTTNVTAISNSIYEYLLKVNTHNLTFVFDPELYPLGVNVKATTPFDTDGIGIIESIKLKLSATTAAEAKYKF